MIVVAFVLAAIVLGLQQVVPLWLLALDGVASVSAFILYGIDKSAAVGDRRRIPEQTLFIVGLIGGWPGAFAAQQVFRHKTKKRFFQMIFWITVLVNVGLAALLITQVPLG